MSERAQRRLAAIVAADVAGYSRLIGDDEEGTLRAMRSHRRELIDPLLAEHGGRIANTAGDSLLLEFSSAVDAVRYAVAMQEGMAARNRDVEASRQIVFRIGIHVGDVVAEGSDMLGDGVNMAARLEGLSEPGGLVMSDDAHRQVRDRLDLAWRDGGAHEVKNIARPIRIWRWPPPSDTPIAGPGEPATLALPDKPSIAVLPFNNLSGDAEQEYFSDGITEDIITNLSRIRWLFVIARNSSFVFKGRAVDVRQVSSELGVRYVLEGSVRKAANKVRISAQLIDAKSSAHLWAERYDRDLTDIFAVQDEITENVAGAIEPAILAAEGLRARSRSEDDIDAWDMVMRAVSDYWRMTKEDSARAIALLEAAVERHPEYGPAHSILSFALLFAAQMGWSDLGSVRETASNLAQKAFVLDDQDPWAHIALGYMHAMGRNSDEAILEYTKAIELSPSFAAAYGWRGFAKAHAGLSAEAIADANVALRLSPKDPQNTIFVGATGLAHYLAGRNDEAISAAEECIRLRPGFLAAHRLRCAALAQSGRTVEAREALETVRKLQPHISASLLRRILPYPSSEYLDKFIEGLRKAGLPE
jgi:TolB-like protein/Tfp pilus assembly protein PilF